MPIYEYQCESCKHKFELKQGFDADPIEKCPLCKATSKRVFHSPAVIYKGSGFYTTDYGRKNYPPTTENNEPSTSVSSSTEEKSNTPTPPTKESSTTPNTD